MGGLLTCCASPAHLTCCSVLSLLGAIFYVPAPAIQVVFYFTIAYQPNFVSFEISKPQQTQWACLASAAFYLSFAIGAMMCAMRRPQSQPIPTSYNHLAQEQPRPASEQYQINRSKHLEEKD